MKRYATLLVAPLILPFVAACGAGDDSAEPSTVTSTTSVAPSSSETTVTSVTTTPVTNKDEDSAILGAPDLSDKYQDFTSTGAIVTDIRVGHHDGFDRVVFDLAGDGVPGWHASYTTEPTAQGSGFPVEYEGAVALNLLITGLILPFELPDAEVSEAIGEFPGAGNITGIDAKGTFEGQGQFVIGLDQERPYSIQILQEPTRIVIDFVS